jgi:hypothetical protein
MSPIKRSLLVATFIVAVASATTFAFTFPGATACLLVEVADLHTLADGVRTDNGLVADQQRYVQLVRDARARIKGTFGSAESKPILVFFNHTDGFGPFRLNAYGSTHFVGRLACVMVGPKGQSVDVVAHELMHAEIHHRVGHLKRSLQLPTWFDEGVAMQVDYRTRYSLLPEDANTVDYVRSLTTVSSFHKGDEQSVVRNYASAKQVVASWLAKVGTTSLYANLQRIRNGEPFAEIVTE